MKDAPADISAPAGQPTWRLDVWVMVPTGFVGMVAGFALGDASLAEPLLVLGVGLGMLFGFRAGALSA